MLHRSAEQIGRTDVGPRPLPALGSTRLASAPPAVDTVLASGLRVIAVRRPAVPMVELRLEIPFGGTHRTHPARAELLAASGSDPVTVDLVAERGDAWPDLKAADSST